MTLANLKILFFLTTLIAILPGFSKAQNGAAARRECFPFENLTPAERKTAEDMLLAALDTEALYTIVGGMKPMSSGFRAFQLPTSLSRMDTREAEKTIAALGGKKADDLTIDQRRLLNQAEQAVERRKTLEEIDETRLILENFRCGGELFADLQHFARAYDGRRFLETVVFSRPRLRAVLADKADFFSRWGITRNSHPLEALYAVERDETGARFAGYGYLFGYPEDAVRFFVSAADEEELTGRFVERDFVSIPTFARETNSFVYAVPKNHRQTDADRTLREKADRILAAYRKRRAAYVGTDKKGVVEMLRDWFCENGKCAPQNARLE